MAAVTDVEVVSRNAPARGLNRVFLAVGIVTGSAAVALSVYVAGHPVIPADITVERSIQLTAWGPLAYAFPFFSWIGDAKGVVVEVVIFFAVLIFNRRTLVVALGGVASGAWYQLGIHLVQRHRPTSALVPHVYEHPGASSYPSGHTIIVTTIAIVLMLCFGHRFLSRWGVAAGWILVLLIVTTSAIARIYSGSHWPSDVLAGILIAVAWISLLLSVRWVSDQVFNRD
jgi:membrane-associated phospholipid phosphatase